MYKSIGKKRMKKLTGCVKVLPVTVGKTDSAWEKLIYRQLK